MWMCKPLDMAYRYTFMKDWGRHVDKKASVDGRASTERDERKRNKRLWVKTRRQPVSVQGSDSSGCIPRDPVSFALQSALCVTGSCPCVLMRRTANGWRQQGSFG